MPSPLASRLFRFTALAVFVGLLAAPSARADVNPPTTTAVWGYTGLILMPTAAVHGFRDFSVGANLITTALSPGVVPFVTAGIFEGLEATVLYGVPLSGFSGLSGTAKYQLIRPTRERPTAVAVGLNLLGVNGINRYVEGNDLFVVISQDVNTTLNGAPYTLFTGHFGFEGNLAGSRLMAGVELPLGEHVSLTGEYLGPEGQTGGFVDVGATYRPLKEWQIRAYTMANPAGPLTDRDYAVGVSYWGNILGKMEGGGDQQVPSPRPSLKPKPSTPSPIQRPIPTHLPLLSVRPTPTPGIVIAPLTITSPAPRPTPTAIEVPTLDGPALVKGSLLDDKGRPLPGWSVGAPAQDRWVVTDLKGHYELELPLGPYELAVRDPRGRIALTKAIRLVQPSGMSLPLVISLPVGELKGVVIDKQTKQPLGDATVQLFGASETYSLADRDNGAFHSDDLPAGDYRVVVTRPRYQAYEGNFSLAARQEKSLIVPLEPKSGALSGKVTNLKGQGQPAFTVAIPKLSLTTATDRLGAYTFQDLPPGQHELVVTHGAKRVSMTLVRIRSDETTTENVTVSGVEAPAANKAGTIAGVVTDASTKRPLAGVKIVVEGGELTVLTITGSDGRYAVGDLPPGRYKLVASRAGYQPRPAVAVVTAKAGATANLALGK